MKRTASALLVVVGFLLVSLFLSCGRNAPVKPPSQETSVGEGSARETKSPAGRLRDDPLLAPLTLTPEQQAKVKVWLDAQGGVFSPAAFARFLQTILDAEQRKTLEKIINAPTMPGTLPAGATGPAQAAAEAPVKTRRVHAFISGRVQGVGFRDFTQREAQRRGLTGWVTNLADGRVEAIIEGTTDKVAELLELVKHGPPNARVDKVETDDETPTGEFKVFSVRQ